MKIENLLLGIFSVCVSALIELNFFALCKKLFFIFDITVSNCLNLAMASMLKNILVILKGLFQYSESFLFPVRISTSTIKKDTVSCHAPRVTPEESDLVVN